MDASGRHDIHPVPPELVFSCTPLDAQGRALFEVVNTVTLAERGGRTTVTVRVNVVASTPAAEPYLAGMEPGWAESLDRLGLLLVSKRAAAPGPKAAKHEALADAPAREIVLWRVLEAPREHVWDAWTDPGEVVRWWGPRGFTTTIETMDVRPGGVWTQVMHGPDGTEYPNKSVFREVVRPERIAFTNGGGRKGGRGASFEATWTFDALDRRRTKLTMRQVFPSGEARERAVREYGAIEGGEQTLERLALHVGAKP